MLSHIALLMDFQFLILGIVIFSIGIGVYLFLQTDRMKLNNKKPIQLDDKADKLMVDLDKVDIKSNSWKEESFLNSSSAEIDQMVGDPKRGREIKYYNLNSLTFSIPYKDSNIVFTESIDMERKTLQMKLALKKTTALFVDPNNPKEYYIDLDFLK